MILLVGKPYEPFLIHIGMIWSGFKKLAKSCTTWLIHKRLGANRVDTVTRYKTESGLAKTRWTQLSSRDDLVNYVKIGENTENNLSTMNNPKSKQKIQIFRDSFEKQTK